MTELMTHNGELYIPSGYNSTMYSYKDKARQALTISCKVNTRTPATMVDYTNIISNNDTSSCFFLLRNLDYLAYGWFLLETNLGSIVTDTKAGHDWAVPHECNYVQIDSQGHRMTGEIDCTGWSMNLGSHFGSIKVNKVTYYGINSMSDSDLNPYNDPKWGGKNLLSHLYTALGPLFLNRKVVL